MLRDLMLTCARLNIVCRQRGSDKVFVKPAEAKRGFILRMTEAVALVSLPRERFFQAGLQQGYELAK